MTKLYNLTYRYYDITVEFPEFQGENRSNRYRRVPGESQVEAVRRVFSDKGGFPFPHRMPWTTAIISCRKVDSYE